MTNGTMASPVVVDHDGRQGRNGRVKERTNERPKGKKERREKENVADLYSRIMQKKEKTKEKIYCE
jgi:hypothetical protein